MQYQSIECTGSVHKICHDNMTPDLDQLTLNRHNSNYFCEEVYGHKNFEKEPCFDHNCEFSKK